MNERMIQREMLLIDLSDRCGMVALPLKMIIFIQQYKYEMIKKQSI